MFEELQMAPPDAILGLTEAFAADTNPKKINLGVGVYKDENGQTPVFAAVKKAEEKILKSETTKNYVGMAGSGQFAKAMQELIFGAGSAIVKAGRAATVQTPGGTGALRVAADFFRQTQPDATIWLSEPTWANHKGVFGAAGVKTAGYPYYDAASKGLDFGGMLGAIEKMPSGDILLLHGCCHNPTGIDPTAEQWGQIADAVARRKVLPFIDFAYQGLAAGLEEDAEGVRKVCERAGEVVIASSLSKNFGLYRERTGSLSVVCGSKAAAASVLSHVKIAVRQNYSNPPSHGAEVATTILNDASLRAEWREEVERMRQRIQQMRELLVGTLKAKGAKQDFSFITRQNGMFSFSGLNREQVERLRQEYSVYIVGSGRINVAGMTPGNMDRLCEAIVAVL